MFVALFTPSGSLLVYLLLYKEAHGVDTERQPGTQHSAFSLHCNANKVGVSRAWIIVVVAPLIRLSPKSFKGYSVF